MIAYINMHSNRLQLILRTVAYSYDSADSSFLSKKRILFLGVISREGNLKEWVQEEREGQHFSNFSFMGGKGVDFYFRKYGSPFKAVWTQTRGPWISPHGESAGVRASSSSILD